MQLIDLIQQILQTGTLPLTTERQLQRLLQATVTETLDDHTLLLIDHLIESLCQGAIRPTA